MSNNPRDLPATPSSLPARSPAYFPEPDFSSLDEPIACDASCEDGEVCDACQ